MRAHFLYLETIMDDFVLVFVWMLPLFFAVETVRSVIDDIKRGKQ